MGSICTMIMAIIICPLLCWYERHGKFLINKKRPLRSFLLRLFVFGVSLTLFVVFFLANFDIFSSSILRLLPKQFVDGSRKVLFAVFGTSSVFTALQSLLMLLSVFMIVATCTLSIVFGSVGYSITLIARFVEVVKTHVKGRKPHFGAQKDNNIQSRLLI